MSSLEIKSLGNEILDAVIKAPPSKAHTLRALYIAALAKGKTIIKHPLIADDQRDTIEALKGLGVKIEEANDEIIIHGVDGKFHPVSDKLYIGNSGATSRVMAVLCALADKDITFAGNDRMNTGRPLQDLLDAVKQLGIDAKSINGNGCPPVRVKANSFLGGNATMKGDKSSQYFTAILLCAPYAKKDVTLTVDGKLVSRPFIDITIEIMREFGVVVVNEDYKRFYVKAGQSYKARTYEIEGDYSGSAFFFEAAAITGGRVRVTNLRGDSVQGEVKFLDLLKEMGCEVKRGKDFVEVQGKPMKGIRVDMADYPDIVPSLAVASAFAEGTTEIYNIAHLKIKESDRIVAPVDELRKMGINGSYTNDSMIIAGGKPHGASIDTHGDHRMVMSFAAAGLKVPGLIINDIENVNKSFPDFFDEFDKLYVKKK